MKKCIKRIFFVLVAILSISAIDIVFAKTVTSSELHFCEYPGTLQVFKILGLFITIIKIVVPLILIITAIVDFFKVVVSGKNDDMTSSISKVAKRVIAGLVVFFIPTIINYAFSEVNKIVGNNEGNKYDACRVCLFETSSCKIPDKNPTYEIK